jgi:hypothetical protein
MHGILRNFSVYITKCNIYLVINKEDYGDLIIRPP